MTARTASVLLLLASALVVSVATERLPQDRGAAGAWQKLLKLQTTASVDAHTAHPDDEHGGMLALLSRGAGARVSLLTLTRGESGDNAIGPELFDGARADPNRGAARRRADTTASTSSTSRRSSTTGSRNVSTRRSRSGARTTCCATWSRSSAIDRPFVLISRFQGNARDGHGNHQAAGLRHAGSVQGRRRSDDVPRADRARGCGRGSR